MKPIDWRSGQGANRSDSRCYRGDLQRRPGREDAVSCATMGVTRHEGLFTQVFAQRIGNDLRAWMRHGER